MSAPRVTTHGRSMLACARAILTVLVVFVAAPLPARADAETWESEWSYILRSGKWDEVSKKLTSAAAEELAKSPQHLTAAARSTARYLHLGLRRDDPNALWVATWFNEVGSRASAGDTSSPAIEQALAAVATVTCRLAGALGRGATADDAKPVAEHAAAYYATASPSDTGETLVDSLGAMRAILAIEGVDAAAVVAAEQDLCAKASAKATGPWAVMAKAELELAKAAASRDAGPAKAGLDRSLALLKPLVSVPTPPVGPATLVNQAIDFGVRRRIVTRPDYVMEEKKSSDNKLRIGIPIGLHWSSGGGGTTSVLAVRKSAPGHPSIHSISVVVYDPARRISTPNIGEALGSDLEGLLGLHLAELKGNGEFKSIKKLKDPKPTSVGRGLGPAYTAEIAGEGSNGNPTVATRMWMVKGKQHTATYDIQTWDYSGSDTISLEFQAVLDSIAELKPSK